jgi:hypothetical protein
MLVSLRHSLLLAVLRYLIATQILTIIEVSSHLLAKLHRYA